MRSLKPLVLAALFLPGIGLVVDLAFDRLGTRPLNELLEPTVMAGLLIWLLGYRLLRRLRRALSPAALALLSLVAGLLTAAGEALCYGLLTGIDPRAVLQANLDMAGQRPAWIVLMVTGAVCAAAWARASVPAYRRSPA